MSEEPRSVGPRVGWFRRGAYSLVNRARRAAGLRVYVPAELNAFSAIELCGELAKARKEAARADLFAADGVERRP